MWPTPLWISVPRAPDYTIRIISTLFRKVAEIIANECLSAVSTTPAINCSVGSYTRWGVRGWGTHFGRRDRKPFTLYTLYLKFIIEFVQFVKAESHVGFMSCLLYETQDPPSPPRQLCPERLERGGPCPLLTVETELNGDSKRTNEMGPFLHGSLDSWCTS